MTSEILVALFDGSLSLEVNLHTVETRFDAYMRFHTDTVVWWPAGRPGFVRYVRDPVTFKSVKSDL